MDNPFTDPRVHAAICPDYVRDRVRIALLDAFETHGVFFPGTGPARVLIKPNLLRGASPERAVTTHPALLVEAARILLERGYAVTVADSPGIGSARGNLRAMGCLGELESMGASVERLADPVPMRLPTGRALPVSRLALEADFLLNLAKWKTHVQTGLTAAVKNLFGCVPGPRKAFQHVGYGHREQEFLAMLIGLAAILRPALTIVDGVVAMEGNGPGSGNPRACGLILSGKDPVALDRVLAGLMGFGDLGMFQVARLAGTGETDPARIPLTGHPLPPVLSPPFLLPEPRPLTFHPLRRAMALLKRDKTEFVFRGDICQPISGTEH